VRRDLAPPPGVIPERDHIRPGAEYRVRELRCDPDAVRDVLAVDDAEVDVALVANRAKVFLDRPSSGAAEHIGDEEDPQGKPTVAAGFTSSATWLPASCVNRASACFSTCERSITRPIFVFDAATVEPTVSAGSGVSCVNDTTSDGAADGWMSICEPYTRPLRTKSVTPVTVPSTGAYTSVPGAAPTSRTSVSPPLSW